MWFTFNKVNLFTADATIAHPHNMATILVKHFKSTDINY